MNAADRPLLPDGVETSFAEIEATMARLAVGDPKLRAVAATRAAAATATVIAVGPRARLVEAGTALKAHAQSGAVRAILIAEGDRLMPRVSVTPSEIALEGLRRDFIDNAIAALRLPSLPAVIWWRGGDPQQAQELARLADRVVLDAAEPGPVWRRISALAREAPVSDLRWAGLTRWRTLMAHFFDLPGVPEAARTFTRLEVAGSDAASARLLAGWLVASLKCRDVRISMDTREGPAIEVVAFGGAEEELSLRRLQGSPCIEGRSRVGGREVCRIATTGDESVAARIGEELRVRARDAAFEAAVVAAGAIA